MKNLSNWEREGREREHWLECLNHDHDFKSLQKIMWAMNKCILSSEFLSLSPFSLSLHSLFLPPIIRIVWERERELCSVSSNHKSHIPSSSTSHFYSLPFVFNSRKREREKQFHFLIIFCLFSLRFVCLIIFTNQIIASETYYSIQRGRGKRIRETDSLYLSISWLFELLTSTLSLLSESYERERERGRESGRERERPLSLVKLSLDICHSRINP